MRFSAIQKGTLARRSVDLPIGGVPVPVDVRPLHGREEIEALSLARRYAIAKGLDNPKEGEPVYDLAVMAHVVLLAAVDHESPEGAPVPFFDHVDQVIELDRDRIQLLYEAQSEWQEETSPRRTKLTPEQYAGLVFALATEEGDGSADDPFLRRLPRATLVSCMRTMAVQLVSSRTPRSPTTASTSSNGESAEGEGGA